MAQPRTRATAASRPERDRDPYEHEELAGYDTVRLIASSLYTEHTEQLDKALAYLGHKLDRLFDRITPALTPYDPADDEIMAAEIERESAGEIIDRLAATTARIRAFTGTVETIHRRLVLPGEAD